MRKLFVVSIIIALAAAGAGIAGWTFWHKVSTPVAGYAPTKFFTVDEGASAGAVADALQQQGIIASATDFRIFVRLDGSGSRFVAGTYDLSPSQPIRDIVHVLTSGLVSQEQQITILEGWTTQEIAEYLKKKGVVTSQEFILAAETADTRKLIPDKNYDFLADKPATAGLEGYLFPDTYRLYKNTRADQIVEKMLDTFGKKFTQEMRSEVKAEGLTVYQAVTLASIVEKEVRTAEDRHIAAGIFLERLKQGMPLQSDATVNYVTGKQALQPTNDDVATDSPYNTYKVKGLPPGPIDNPSLASLEAVANPTKSAYLYFLTKPDGSTVFSTTYEEHLANKQKYLK